MSGTQDVNMASSSDEAASGTRVNARASTMNIDDDDAHGAAANEEESEEVLDRRVREHGAMLFRMKPGTRTYFNRTPETFRMLHFYGNGQPDCVVHLAHAEQGNLVVVKTHNDPRELEKEAGCWYTWNDVETAYVTTGNDNRHMLVMPFAYAYDPTKRAFIGPNRRARDKRLSSGERAPEGHYDMIEQMPTPEEAKAAFIKQAVKMAWHGIAHGNLKDEHMAMLPVPPTSPSGRWTVRPVFIDFGHVQDPLPPRSIMRTIREWARRGVQVDAVATFPMPEQRILRPFGLPYLVEPREGWTTWIERNPTWANECVAQGTSAAAREGFQKRFNTWHELRRRLRATAATSTPTFMFIGKPGDTFLDSMPSIEVSDQQLSSPFPRSESESESDDAEQ